MRQKLGFGFLNFDRELGSLCEAATNLEKAPAGCEPALNAYIQALKTLNTAMLGLLDSHLRGNPGEALPSLRGPRGRRECHGIAVQSQAVRDAVHAATGPIANRRSQRIGAAVTQR
jgi:hypothetical protein